MSLPADQAVAPASWRALFSGTHALAAVVLAGGVALQAIETFVGSTVLPSAVLEIGGLELFAWNTTIFIVFSIVAAVCAAMRPLGIGDRALYLWAAAAFAIGSLICGLAPTMPVMLAGRALQGFGGGLLTATSYALIRVVIPQPLWGRAFALISSVWGIATLLGPTLGGVFATLGAWRWAFHLLVPCALLLALLALRALPAGGNGTGARRFPLIQILLLIGAVLAVSVASILTDSVPLQALLVGLAALAILALGVLARRREIRLLPTGSFSLATPIAPLLGAMMLLQLAIVCDIFVPLFLQTLHGQTPLVAGYILALVAAGWSGSSIVTSAWTGSRARLLIVLGPILHFCGIVGLFVFLPRANPTGELLPLLPIGLCLLLLGMGIGIAWPQISPRILKAAPAGEGDLTSASISMVQLFANGFGAALAGTIVNAAGLASADLTAGTISAAHWLFGSFAVVPLLALPLVLLITRRERREPALVPAE